MSIRSLVLFSFAAAAFSLAPSARASGSGGSGGSSTTSSAASGASSSSYDPNCSVDEAQGAGETCAACDPTGTACSALGSDYNLACQSSAKAAVYCNGPDRTSYSDQNVACSVSVPGGGWSGAATAGALVAAAALMMRRRRR